MRRQRDIFLARFGVLFLVVCRLYSLGAVDGETLPGVDPPTPLTAPDWVWARVRVPVCPTVTEVMRAVIVLTVDNITPSPCPQSSYPPHDPIAHRPPDAILAVFRHPVVLSIFCSFLLIPYLVQVGHHLTNPGPAREWRWPLNIHPLAATCLALSHSLFVRHVFDRPPVPVRRPLRVMLVLVGLWPVRWPVSYRAPVPVRRLALVRRLEEIV